MKRSKLFSTGKKLRRRIGTREEQLERKIAERKRQLAAYQEPQPQMTREQMFWAKIAGELQNLQVA